MKKPRNPPAEAGHQTVTEFIEVPTPHEAIQIGFTDQKVSGHAGLATFCGFLHWHRFGAMLGKVLPHVRTSAKAIAPADLALGFLAGILAGAKKLTHVAHLRRDVLLAPLLAIARIGSQSTFTRFFQGFTGSGQNLATFGPLWRWAMLQLPSRPGGYSLDLDSTRLLHEDGQQEGVKTGYTRLGLKPCLHPLLAVLEEAKLVVGFWLRPGNCACANNVVAFTIDLLASLPRHLRLRLVRADSGFCDAAWLALLDDRGLRYIVVAKLLAPLHRLCRQETIWQPTEVPGTAVAEVWHREQGWDRERRVILVRHHVVEKARPGGKRLIEVPGYLFQAFVTNHPVRVPPIEIWRDYNPRAGCEGVIKQLDADFALPDLCVKKFWGTEAAMSLAVLSYNLCVLFQRHLGWQERVTAATLRFRLFTTGGIISQTGGRTTLRLSVPAADRDWWRAIFEKIVSVYPNCNAVSARGP